MAPTTAAATCTGAAEVASLPAPTKDHVDATWLSAALGLPATAVASVLVRPFEGGFSPIIKAHLAVTYSPDARATPAAAESGANPRAGDEHGARDPRRVESSRADSESNRLPRTLFMKLLPADTSASAHQLGEAVIAMVKQAHRVEASFYALAMASSSTSSTNNDSAYPHSGPTCAAGPTSVNTTLANTTRATSWVLTGRLSAIVPRAYHANPDQAILLADMSSSATSTSGGSVHTTGYEALSAWSMDLTDGPDVERDALVAIVRALAVLHTAGQKNEVRGGVGGEVGEGTPPETAGLLTWDALIESRTARVMIPVERSADKLAALMLKFAAHFCPGEAEPGRPLHALCAAASQVGYAQLMRAIALPPPPSALPRGVLPTAVSPPVLPPAALPPTAPASDHSGGGEISSGGILHGDPNPGNVLYNKGRREALLIDFQDTAAGAPGVVDLARLLISSMHPASRAKLQEDIVQAYLQAYQQQQQQQELQEQQQEQGEQQGAGAETAAGLAGMSPKPELPHSQPLSPPLPLSSSFKRDLLLALLADAMLIMASVAFSLEARSPALFYALGERSIMCLRDHCEEMLAVVREVAVQGNTG